jgi:hypothetical protein
MEQHSLNQSATSRAREDTRKWLLDHIVAWVLAFLLPGGGTMLTTLMLPSDVSIKMAAVYGFIGGFLGLILLLVTTYVIHLILAPYRQRNEARNMIEQLLHTHFYLKFEGYDEKMLSLPPAPFKGSTSFKLTISNQENVPRSVSKFMLEIELENGDKKELPAMNPDGKTEADISLYLQPRESKIVWLNFVYEVKPIQGSKKLYVFDDLGAWCRVPINADTMVTMAKKSMSRSGDYLPL